MDHPTEREKTIIVAGGGLTGLSAGYSLTKAGFRVKVIERDAFVGGLSRTVVHNGFRFDLGGHRFFTKNEETNKLVKELMDGEMVSVPRKSKIFLRNRYFDYPLKPLNALFGLGIPTTLKIISDYIAERARRLKGSPEQLSLEDWVVSNFGRTMFNIYFKEYSEKVWGIDCSRISVDWVAQRIRGLSLAGAVKNAFFKFSGRDIPSLVDRFDYPELGIGRISERFKEEIEKYNAVFTGTEVERIYHSAYHIDSIEVKGPSGCSIIGGDEFISSIPITKLVRVLRPAPPRHILEAAAHLKFRDLVVVTLMIDRERVTDQTWIYLPEQKIPLGRIHEPTNWSAKMAPPGKTLIVAEFFSTVGDAIWNKSDGDLAGIAAKTLEQLGFIQQSEVIDSCVVRAPKAYPLFEIGYAGICESIYNYLNKFSNLHIAGRVGKFRYYNMDHAMESGMSAAEEIMKRSNDSPHKGKVPLTWVRKN